jgi:twinkle protein
MPKDVHENIRGLPCPYEACGSSDAFCYNTRGFGQCHSCNTAYPSKEITFSWAKEKYPPVGQKSSAKVRETQGDGKYVSIRGISERTMEHYNVLTYGDKDTQNYVYPSGGIKTRNLKEKGFYTSQGFKQELFGMNFFTAGCSKTLTITEGEVDAMSAYQMLTTSEAYLNPVVSLPSATPSKSMWENCKPYLDSFSKIVLSIDNDEAGDAVADKIAKMFPNKVYRVPHNKHKDANDFLVNGAAVEFKAAWFNASKYVPENIFHTTEQFISLYEDTPEHQYVPTGIEALDDKILGLMQGHFTVIKAPTGIGKTEVMRYLEYNMIQRNVPIATWHLEETKLRSLLGLVSYVARDNLTRRDLIAEKGAEDRVKDAIRKLTKDELLYQFYLEDGQGSDDLCDQIRFFSQACGCKFVFFEPIQDVVTGSSEESKEQQLADLSVRLSKLAADLNIGIVTIAHTNEYGDPKYCKMIGQRASVVLDLQRDKEANTLEEKNTTYITVQKNRPCSIEGSAGKLRFSTETFNLREVL